MQFLDIHQKETFQFPLLGIFPCINISDFVRRYFVTDFQFPLLGIFPCIVVKGILRGKLDSNFQFPLLGIFPCISKFFTLHAHKNTVTFNSLYLGFSLASAFRRCICECASSFFQFPLLGIFPCIVGRKEKGWVNLVILSIPFTWDFPLHRGRKHGMAHL